MKNVLLSADNEISVFSVPNEVADNLEQYCLEFCCNWLPNDPNAAKYRDKTENGTVLCYTEKDFINYINQYICHENSSLVTTLADVYDEDEIPDEYVGLPCFYF